MCSFLVLHKYNNSCHQLSAILHCCSDLPVDTLASNNCNKCSALLPYASNLPVGTLASKPLVIMPTQSAKTSNMENVPAVSVPNSRYNEKKVVAKVIGVHWRIIEAILHGTAHPSTFAIRSPTRNAKASIEEIFKECISASPAAAAVAASAAARVEPGTTAEEGAGERAPSEHPPKGFPRDPAATWPGLLCTPLI